MVRRAALSVVLIILAHAASARAAVITLEGGSGYTIVRTGADSGRPDDIFEAEVAGFRIRSTGHYHLLSTELATFFSTDSTGIQISRIDGATFTPLSVDLAVSGFFPGVGDTAPYFWNDGTPRDFLRATSGVMAFSGPAWTNIRSLNLGWTGSPQAPFPGSVDVRERLLSVTVDVIPEPATAALLLVGAGFVARRLRRRR